jgi:Skp family chaperone for outer membrane proteins
MKKVSLILLTSAALIITSFKANAQQNPMKIGVFDIDMMVQTMPGYPAVDSMVQIFEKDSLAAEYDFYRSEYGRLDTTYKLDSAAGKSKSVLALEQQQRQQIALTLVYWQQYAQNKSDQKRAELAQGLYEKVVNAYRDVLTTKKYTLILKPQSIEKGTTPSSALGGVDNIFKLVAAELKIPLAPELGGGQQDQSQDDQQQAPAKPKPAGTSTKPKQ